MTVKALDSGYRVGIRLGGDWQLAALQQQLDDPLLKHVSGHSPWQARVGVNLHDTGFDYDVDLQAPLTAVNSRLPYPLGISAGTEHRLRLDGGGERRVPDRQDHGAGCALSGDDQPIAGATGN